MGVLKLLGGLIAALVVAGVAYQQISAARDRQNFPPPGEMIDIGGRELHLFCMGPENGQPLVLLEGGTTFISTGWIRVMEPLAEETRVCAYDRAGAGWSDEATGARYGADLVRDLHDLREAAGISEPMLFVGHSLGGMLGRIYYDHYPEEMAGLIMIEPGDPEIILAEFEEEDGVRLPRRSGERKCGINCPMATVFTEIGVTRLIINSLSELDDRKLPRDAVGAYKARMSLSPNVRAMAYMGKYLATIFHETADNETLGDIPAMVIFGDGAGRLLGDHNSEEERLADNEKQKVAGAKTTALSSRDYGVVEIESENHLAIITYEDSAKVAATHILRVIDDIKAAN